MRIYSLYISAVQARTILCALRRGGRDEQAIADVIEAKLDIEGDGDHTHDIDPLPPIMHKTGEREK